MEPSRSQSITERLSASVRCVALLASLSLTGCAALCFGPTSDHNSVQASKPAATHRPPIAFPEEPGDDSDSPLPQTVNVFGEVNGAAPRAATLTGDVAFQQHTFADEGYDADVAIDPTGKWLVFASTRNSEHPSIYLQRVDGTAVTQLTDGACDDAYPVFSPDGKQIAFSSTRAGNWQIYTMDADGRNVVQLTTGPMQGIHPSFSPDGSNNDLLFDRRPQRAMGIVDAGLENKRKADDRVWRVSLLVAGQDGKSHCVPAGAAARFALVQPLDDRPD